MTPSLSVVTNRGLQFSSLYLVSNWTLWVQGLGAQSIRLDALCGNLPRTPGSAPPFTNWILSLGVAELLANSAGGVFATTRLPIQVQKGLSGDRMGFGIETLVAWHHDNYRTRDMRSLLQQQVSVLHHRTHKQHKPKQNPCS